MRIGELILRHLSRDPAAGDYIEGTDRSASDPLKLLKREFSDLESMVSGKRVLDFGCGRGLQAVALVKEFDCSVCGLDTNTRTLEAARGFAKESDIPEERLWFREGVEKDMAGSFDVVISQNAMEHFPDPAAVLEQMKSFIGEGGIILISFGPPWFAPYGAHMHFFSRVPWIQLFFSERTVMKVRGLYRNDGAQRYEDVESGLNKMTVAKFERLVAQSGLVLSWKRYGCIKGLDWLGTIPGLRELFVNHISCILSSNNDAPGLSATAGKSLS